MQLPKKKNSRMPRWSIRPSWSSANASHGLSTGTGPVDSPPLALRWSMVMHAEVVLELLHDVDHRGRPVADARVQAAAGRRQQREAGADLVVADADIALLVESDLGARRQALRRCLPCGALREHLRRGGCRGGGSAGCQNGASARIDHRLPPLSLSRRIALRPMAPGT